MYLCYYAMSLLLLLILYAQIEYHISTLTCTFYYMYVMCLSLTPHNIVYSIKYGIWYGI